MRVEDGPGSHLVDLDANQCRELLVEHRWGRIAWDDPEWGPSLLPVNYRVDGDEVVLRTSHHTELARRLRPGRASFQIDEYDESTGTGWSVLVRGVARPDAWGEVTPPVQPPTPAARGTREFYVRLGMERLTGRRLLPA